ncbi:unnamed protein product [Effrenium voratum]|uniref:TLDc domain-containing protein n=1 Tax=Effrenium voratum TaxID=2562239 RepID=A0AA36MY09_9DINO|nr:unnamed protein product [Effrenium voratum]
MTSVSVGAPVPSESRRWSGPELLALAASQGGAYLGFGLQYALLTPFVLELGVPVRWASIIWLGGPITVFSTLQRSAIKAKRIAVSFPNEAMSVLRCLVFFGVVAYGAAMKSSMSALRSIVNGTGSQAPGLSQMQLAVQQLLGNAGSPGMTDFSAQLDKVIEEQMKKAVLTSKGTLQTELDGHYSSGYDACDASLSTSQGTDGVLDKKTSVFTAAAAQHKTCRTQEAADATAKDTCDSQESELKTKKEAACKVVSDYDSSTVTNCARQGGESYVTYTGRLVVYYQAELEKAKKAEELCETATKDYDAKVAECTGLKSEWEKQRAACNTQQETMDTASCTVLSTSATVCEEYAACNEKATTSYNSDKSSVQSQEASLKSEWIALMHMQCLLGVFSKSDNERAAAMKACNDKDFQPAADAALSLTYPAKVPRDPKSCASASNTVQSASYAETHYDTLPSNAQAKTCIAECCAKCDSFTCPWGYAQKDNAQNIFGALRDECCEESLLLQGSHLVTDENQIRLISGWMQQFGWATSGWTLCYRKSTHGGTGSTWHSQCNNKGKTISIIKLSTGRVIGGMTSIPWKGANSRYWSSSYGKGALFSLTNSFLHTVKNTNYVTYDRADYGPCFGGGHDFVIYNTWGGYCNIGHSYNCRVGSYAKSDCRNDFCGNYNSWSVQELETYYLN